jgi:hypothetical protein
MKILNAATFKNSILSYLEKVYIGIPGRYRSCIGGHETLYASCFALKIHHYLGALSSYDPEHLHEWGRYILDHQDEKSGYFLGPEISKGRLYSDAHSREHLSEHLTVHVLPALKILGTKPMFPLRNAHRYVDIDYLSRWLSERDWKNAWLEGNNLLFVGQLLTYLFEEEGIVEAKKAVEYMLNWLDAQADPATGLWGTASFCDTYDAVYGGYHQLLLYYYWEKPVSNQTAIIDTVLSIQHADGGFSRAWGGGTCEDVDAVDILVNMYKMGTYKRNYIETALRKVFMNIWRRFTDEGGFTYKLGEDFMHMGMEYTYAPKNAANMFSTWFSLHTILLISEVIDLPCTRGLNYNFNLSCSMGWHRRDKVVRKSFHNRDFVQVLKTQLIGDIYNIAKQMKEKSCLLSHAYRIVRQLK